MLRQSLFANAGYLTGTTALASLAGVAFWGIAARLCSADDIGLASGMLAAVALVCGIANMGVGMGLIRFLPRAARPGRLINSTALFGGLSALLIGGVYLLGLPYWSPSLLALRKDRLSLALFLGYSAVMVLGGILRAAFIAQRKTVLQLIQTVLLSAGRLGLLVPLAALGAIGLVGANAIAAAGAVALGFLWFLPQAQPGYAPQPALAWRDLRGILPFSLGNHVAGLLTQGAQWILTLITLELLGPASGGYAQIAWMVGDILSVPGTALAGSAFAEGANSPGQKNHVLQSAARAGLLISVPAALLASAAAPWLLQFFGEGYAQHGTGLLRWKAVAAPLVVLAQLYYTQLRLQKRVSRLIWVSNVAPAAALCVAYVLMPKMGVSAGGIGWAAGHALAVALAASELARDGRLSSLVRHLRAGRVWTAVQALRHRIALSSKR